MSQHRDTYACKRLRTLEYLQKNGFKPFATVPDPSNPKYNWWLFENSPEFEKCITAYFEQLQSRGKK